MVGQGVLGPGLLIMMGLKVKKFNNIKAAML
jgi:hypothetical protein